MRSKLAFALVALAALAGASLAVAKGGDNRNVSVVSGTFAAAGSGKSESRSCTTTDGKTLVSTHRVYAGSAAGSPDLTGAITVDARSLIDTTDDIGRVDGRLRIVTGSGRTELQFTGVYDHGTVAGLATGHAATHAVQLVANLSSGFSAGTGFTGGKIGAGSSGGSALALGPGRCKPTPKPRKEVVSAEGSVTAVSTTSITVAGLTCTVPAGMAARLAKLQLTTGTRVRISCTVENGTATLTKIDRKR